MLLDRTDTARYDLPGVRSCGAGPAPRDAVTCRMGFAARIGFAALLLMLTGVPPAVGDDHVATRRQVSVPAAVGGLGVVDEDRNGIEDILDQHRRGAVPFSALREHATREADRARADAAKNSPQRPAAELGSATAGSWSEGTLRLLVLDAPPANLAGAVAKAAGGGLCRVRTSTTRFGGMTVLETDAAGLSALLAAPPPGRLVLDREGVPALDASRTMVGVPRVETGVWRLGNDGSFSLAILDSGCDTAHGDLGDDGDDDRDGPPPAVGDAGDWYPATNGWPFFAGYKVVGWHDVTDDFPGAVGPWDYHHHGTALASVAAGRGVVSPSLRGVAPGARLVIVKCYDFDVVWRIWAGDFLAACAWVLDQRDVLRIGPVLMAVNWDADLGIAAAVHELAEAGMTPVAAMGNFGFSGLPGWPARSPDALTVGAVGDDGAVAAFSGRGSLVTDKPDLVAPGGGLLSSAGRVECADNEPDDSYSERWGTSLAAAHVAGALHLLDEALAEQGIALARDLTAVRTRQAVLRLTSAPVAAAETPDGVGRLPLPSGSAPRDDRGWGLLRIDAAVQAILRPLRPGRDQIDTLLSDGSRPVVARRLDLQPGIRYLVEASPSVGLDIELVVADPRALDDERTDAQVSRLNQGGSGTSEFTYCTGEEDRWRLLAVKRLSGQGTVVLRLREADSFTQQGAWLQLPGTATGFPNAGLFPTFSGTSFVVPSMVAVDPVARSVNLIAAAGSYRPGWPVFVFPHPSAQGGLNQPLCWDLDGVPGDEIVLSSEYGSVYFFAAGGSYQTVNLALNRSLTVPVGFTTATGQRRVLVVDKLGNAYAWRHGPVLVASTALGHALPLPPAGGMLTVGGGESVVVAFADGHVAALDEALVPLPGWPVDLGAPPASAPVLCDLDDDGRHEVIVAVLSAASGALVIRVFDGAGQSAPGDGAVVVAPGGGTWLAVSVPVVAGRYGTGELHVALIGLFTNGLTGDQAAWGLGIGRFAPGGVTSAVALPGFRVRAANNQGELRADKVILAPPIAWNQRGGWGIDVAALVHLSWHELLYGLASIPGSMTAWFADTEAGRALAQRQPVLAGGEVAPFASSVGAALARVDDHLLLRLDVLDRGVTVTPVLDHFPSSSLWAAARADTRNSGAFPLNAYVAEVAAPSMRAVRLSAHPNPGSGPFHFRFPAASEGAPVDLEVYDLRGRRVLKAEVAADSEGAFGWVGQAADGRKLPAGTYLVRARTARQSAVTRVTITR